MTEGRDAQRRHGARSRPPRADITLHLEHILGATPGAAELLEPNETIAVAFHLAECETRLDRAHRHYAEAQGVHRHAVLDHPQDHLEDFMYFDWAEDPARREAAARVMRLERLSTRYANHGKKLAGRYLQEAQSRRDRALEHYLSQC
jgi:hypothetical protein